MKITLVPSAVSVGGGNPGFFLSSYLIDEVVAIDAGGLGFIDDLSAQQRIEHIFITHSHMDHIASLPIFLDTVFQAGEPLRDGSRRRGDARELEARRVQRSGLARLHRDVGEAELRS